MRCYGRHILKRNRWSKNTRVNIVFNLKERMWDIKLNPTLERSPKINQYELASKAQNKQYRTNQIK